MHIHRLDLKRHFHLLDEQRFDPITGEVLKAGDEVVFCACCHSAFLDESWEYIGGEHCKQFNTLPYAPVPYTPLILEKPKTYPPIYKTMWNPYGGDFWDKAAIWVLILFCVMLFFYLTIWL